MGINKENYEQFFLDYLEGNLSPEEKQELADFIIAHPELRSLLDDFDGTPIPPDRITYLKKERLKKNIHNSVHINEGNAEAWMIASIEGNLNATEAFELSEFISKNPVFERELELYRKTRIVPDETITFPLKSSLKKKAPYILLKRSGWISALVAAVIILFFGIRFFLLRPPSPDALPEMTIASGSAGIDQTIPTTASESLPENPKKILAASHAAVPEQPVTGADTATATSERTGVSRIKDRHFVLSVNTSSTTTSYLSLKNETEAPKIKVEKNQPLISKVTENIFAQAGKSIRERTRLDNIRNQRLNFWGVLSSGIKGYNTITDRNVELFVRQDEKGKVSSYTLVEHDRLIMTRDLNKN